MVKQADVYMLNGIYQQRNMKMHDDEGTLISEMLTLTALLGGRMERYDTYSSTGKTSKKIIIEYNVEENER
tara:strand:+ start:79 stop:291 length:213 start_codon:yes stop_codon:yes gene_type:complete